MDKTREELVKKFAEISARIRGAAAPSDDVLAERDGVRKQIELIDLRMKAKARLMMRLYVQSYDHHCSTPTDSLEICRTDAGLIVDDMTDDEVLLVEW